MGSRSGGSVREGWGWGAGEGGLPLLLHLLAPTAPEKAEGTCETCRVGRWGFGRRGMIDAALPACWLGCSRGMGFLHITRNGHGDGVGRCICICISSLRSILLHRDRGLSAYRLAYLIDHDHANVLVHVSTLLNRAGVAPPPYSLRSYLIAVAGQISPVCAAAFLG